MARHGENIRKRKDGRWEGRYQVYDQESKRKSTGQCTPNPTRKSAKNSKS